MNEIPFKARIRDIGNSSVITIPHSFIDNGMLKTGEEYDFVVKKGEKSGLLSEKSESQPEN